MANTLQVTWTDPRGVVWDLTRGDRGVILDRGQSGLGWPEIKQHYDGPTWLSATVGVGMPKLLVRIADHLRGEDYYRLASEWWEQANSPFDTGTLSVSRPGQMPRTRVCRLGIEPDTEWDYDPGLPGTERPPELWGLAGVSPWWEGTPQTVTFTPGQVAGAAGGTPFYGASGSGWPLYIGAAAAAEDAFLTNTGTGPMWPVWTITGPASFPRVGTAEGTLTYSGTLAAGEQLVIETDPARRRVYEASSGESRWALVSGAWLPIPRAERVPLVLAAEGMTAASSISVTASAMHATAF